jgi:hypothetical protein
MLKKRTTARQRDNGVRVVNYARWKSREDFDAMVKNPEAKAHMKPIMGIAEIDFHLYGVADSFELSPTNSTRRYAAH